MKKFFQMGLILCGVLFTQVGFANYGGPDFNPSNGNGYGDVTYSGSYDTGIKEQACEQPAQPTGDCWCMYCKYEPCYNNCWRCIEEPKYCQVKRCRYVPKYYTVKRCRWVPEYYDEQVCRQEPEYYCDTVCTTCKRWVCDQKCTYKPRYFWKRSCNPAPQQCCPTAAPVQSGCPSGQCGARY